MPLFAPQNLDNDAALRRILVVVDVGESVLAPELGRHGYEAQAVPLKRALETLKTFTPDLVILELYQGYVGGNAEALYLARRLRTEPELYATPLVIAWGEEQKALRQAAAYMGADDYFSLALPFEIILARLDSLFWRVAIGRRTAMLIGDQRLEIENFILLTDAVRWDMERGWGGTLALVQAVSREKSMALDYVATESALTAICGFLKLQMRRMDSVVFYDASTLLVYLPHLPTPIALGALTRLRTEFLEAQKSCDMAIGLVSFPSDGQELDELLERAATASLQARSNEQFRRVVAYGLSSPVRNEAATWDTPSAVYLEETRLSEVRLPSAGASGNLSGRLRLDAPPAPTHNFVTETAPPDIVPLRRPELETSPRPRSEDVPQRPRPTPASVTAPLPQLDAFPITYADEPLPPTLLPPAPDLAVDLPLPSALPPATTLARVASLQEIEQSLRPPEGCRLLLAVSHPERLAQLNTLARSAGYEVRPAFDGPHALGLLRIDRPHLLLLDYDVSGLNGLETLRRIQAQHGGRLPVKVIMLAPPDALAIKTEAEALGVFRVLTLPYAPVELMTALRQAVSTN